MYPLLTLRYRVGVADVEAFNAHFVRQRLRAHGLWRFVATVGRWAIIGLIASLVFRLVSDFDRTSENLIARWPMLLGLLAASAVGLGMLYAVFLRPVLTSLSVRDARRSVRRLLKEDSQQPLLGEQTLELREDGIAQKASAIEIRVPWKSIGSLAETKDHIFLHLGSMHAFIIPKRDVTRADLDEFKAIVKKIAPTASPA